MCGIWGAIPAPNTALEHMRKFVTSALIAGTVRGDHGSGMMFVGNKQIEVVKGMEDGANLLYSKKARGMLENKNIVHAWAIVGHNRAATTGDISDESAHPFQHGPITLVHNGGVTSPASLPGITLPIDKLRVDSDVLCESFSKVAPEKVLPTLWGAYALVWHDARDEKIRIVRNMQRPLHFMRTSCGALLFASEGDMLWWVAGRAGFARTEVRELATGVILTIDSTGDITGEAVPFQRYNSHHPTLPQVPQASLTSHPSTPASEAQPKSFQYVPPAPKLGVLGKLGLRGNTMMEFEINSVEPWHAQQKRYSGVAHDTSKKNPQLHNAVMFMHEQAGLDVGSCINVRPVGLYRGRDARAKGGTPIIVVHNSSPTAQTDFVQQGKLYKGPQGKMLTETEWLEAVGLGCVQCRETINIEDADSVRWMINETQPMCATCVDEWQDYCRSRNGTGDE